MHTKMNEISLIHKFLIIALIICLTIPNFLGVAVYATSAILDSQTSETINKNVKFDTYFAQDNGNTHYLICDVNSTNETMRMNLSVLAGYLKQAQIEIKDANYNLLNIVDKGAKIQAAEDDKIELKQINEGETVELELTIGNITHNEMSLLDMSKDSKIVLTAIYVDEKGKEIEIEKEIMLNISWTGEFETELSSELVKYTKFVKDGKEKMLVQVLTKTGLKESANKLPIKETNINVTVPKLEGTAPEEILVIAKNTIGTNGAKEGRAEIPAENIVKATEQGIVTVKIENKPTENIVWNGKGQDELLFTYIYDMEAITGQNAVITPILTSTINSEITTYNGTETSKWNTELIANYDLSEVAGNVISLSTNSTTTELNKGKIYANTDVEEKQYETIYNVTTLSEVSYKDMVSELKIEEIDTYFVDAKSNKYLLENSETVYTYYKSTTISKANFDKVLGEAGEINILDTAKNTVAKINKSLETNENGDYVVNYTSKYSKLTFETTKPVAEGELLISSEKAISADLPYAKQEARKFTSLVSEFQISQKENNEYLNLESKQITIPLTETNTNANLVLSTDVLSTIVNNENVEIKIELDNARENTDLYKAGTFKIVFPEYIEDVVINTANILYADGIIAKQVEKQIENEKVVIYITLDGAQERFSTGSVTNGTNIILNTDIKTKLLTPSTDDVVKMYYSHNNSTSYVNTDETTEKGYAEAKVKFAAPVGMLAVSRISGYEATGKSIISVNQGTVVDKIKMDSDAINATMELMLINNTGDTCKTVSVIGRIPFEGNKKIGTDEDLKTTVNTTIIQGVEVQGDVAEFAKVYYSTNGEATEDLSDLANEWTQTPEDFSTIKSYMIVFENYEFKHGETLNMFYNFLVPEMIDLNNSLYGTFGASYEKDSEIGLQEESVVADTVGLTTGTGPVMEINQKVSVGEDGVIQEGQLIKYTITVKNAGTSNIENLKIKDLIPEYTGYVEYREPGPLGGTEGTYEYAETQTDSDGKQYIEWNIGTVKPEETVTKELYLRVSKLPTIMEYYDKDAGVYEFAENEFFTIDETTGKYYLSKFDETTGETSKTEITSIPEIKIFNTLNLTATDLELKVSKSSENKIEKVYFVVDETASKSTTEILRENEELTYTITVKNNTETVVNNIQVEKVLPEGITYNKGIATIYNTTTGETSEVAEAAYTSENRLAALTIPSLEAGQTATVTIKVVTSKLVDGVYDKDIITSTAIYANGINKHITTELKNTVAKPHLILTQTDNLGGEYLIEGKAITFTLKIKNESKISTDIIKIKDILSDKVTGTGYRYSVTGAGAVQGNINNNELEISKNIGPGEELVVEVTAVANELPNSVKEESFENVFTLSGDIIGEISSNVLKKTVEQSTLPNEPEKEEQDKPNTDKPNTDKPGTTPPSGDTEKPEEIKTYKIKGTAWLDENANGARENNEKIFAGVKVTLINAKTGDIIIDRTSGKAKETTTSGIGTYEFDNLVQGEYIVVFYHNSELYGLTEYAKTGVNTEQNSDVILTTIKENDKNITVAVTNTLKIDTNSLSGIDMGLVINKTADLRLDKYISQVTVQNKQGVKTYTYDNTTLAKVDIKSKYMAGSVVVVEYSIVVKNEGNLAAYAKQIVDYMPADFKFNSDLNSNWYAGNDGNLYSTELANTIINPGESKTIKLVLTKTMTDTNIGLSNNRAEIYEEYNELGLADTDSRPNNQAQGEDDIGAANVLISVATGAEVTYTTTILVGLVILATGIYFIRRKTSRYYN